MLSRAEDWRSASRHGTGSSEADSRRITATSPSLFAGVRTVISVASSGIHWASTEALAVQYAALPPVSALVVSRLVTPAEAGWEPDERVRWLQGLATVERLQLLEDRTHAAIVREQHGGRPAAPPQPFS